MIRTGLLNGTWVASNVRWRRALKRACIRPEHTQAQRLATILAANRESAFGRAHGFAKITSVSDYRARVPIAVHDDFQPWIERIVRGEPRVLTTEPVTRLIPSSGSSAARKLIPYTQSLRAEFNRGIGAWISDLYLSRPALLPGSAYWSITPIVPMDVCGDSAVPIGFERDSQYLGRWLAPLVDATFAVRAAVAESPDLETFRYVTLRDLLGARDLSLISVWHPSFLALLLDAAAEHWDALIDDIATGGLNAPGELPQSLRNRLRRRPQPERAAELRDGLARGWPGVWPKLGLISCWTDAHAEGAARALAASFPGVELQAKGLVASEAFVSLPFGDVRPVSLLSHFFEFLDEDERPHLAHEMRDGEEYSVVVTTGGGLYRYRLRDRVRSEGRCRATPGLRFLGKEDSVSDRFGEKLADAHVANVISRLFVHAGSQPLFTMLAPDQRPNGIGYTLYFQSSAGEQQARSDTGAGTRADVETALAQRLELELRRNPHYAYCVDLGQLQPARAYQVTEAAHQRYLEHRARCGQRLGDIKPVALSTETGWTDRLNGAYLS